LYKLEKNIIVAVTVSASSQTSESDIRCREGRFRVQTSAGRDGE